MKRFSISLFICISWTFLALGQSNATFEKTVNDFVSADWPAVLQAKEKLENSGKDCVPSVIDLMKDCKTHKLENTGDLIFPGAEKYFGHGQIVDYDIDDICVRAGWLLEELTFMNFGFTGIHLPDDELLDFIRITFPDYYNSDEGQRQLGELTANGKRKLIKTLSIEQVRNWWIKSSTKWNRIDALVDALNSKDEKRQVKALFYIRNGTTTCIGLTKAFYRSKLENTIEKLSNSTISRVSENAKLIMLDDDFKWLDLKTNN